MTLRQLLPEIAPGERVRFAFITAGWVCVASGALVARATGDTLFLSRFGAEFLPYMYIGSAALLTIAAYILGIFARRVPAPRLAASVGVLLILLALALRQALVADGDNARIAAYFLADLNISLPTMLFWALVAMAFNPREAKRLVGVIGAGGTLACIVAGLSVRPFAARFGTLNLLLVTTALLGGFVAAVLGLSHYEATRFPAPPRGDGARQGRKRGPKVGYYAQLLKTRQVRNLALLLVCTTVVVFLVDYQFKRAARGLYEGPALAGFLGNFYGVANVASLLLQIFVVHIVLQKGGVLLSLGILLGGFAIAAIGTALTSGFPWIVATRILDPIFNFTINNAALQMLYLGIKKQTRGQARAFVEGMCKPLAMALTGTALILGAGALPISTMSLIIAALSLAWVLMAWRNHAAYVAGLLDLVGARRFEVPQDGEEVSSRVLEAHMRQALLSASDEDLPYLMGILPQLGKADLTTEVCHALGREAPAVKIAAIDYLAQMARPESLPHILSHVRHENPEVRAKALHGLAAWGTRPEVILALESCLGDPHPLVRASAAAELINTADLDGLLAAGVALKTMLTDPSAETRAAATEQLTSIKRAQLVRLLRTLLTDPDPGVRTIALGACRSHPSPELIPNILPHLSDRLVSSPASEALASLGAAAILPLATLLDQPSSADGEQRFAALRVPLILAKIGDSRGLAILGRHLGDADLALRSETIRAWCILVQKQSVMTPYLAETSAATEREIGEARRYRRILDRVEVVPAAELLGDAAREVYQRHLQNLFALLDLVSPGVSMPSVYQSLTQGSAERRAEALELLDNVLTPNLREQVLPLFERRDADAARAVASVENGLVQVVELLDAANNEWILVGAAYAAGENRCLEATNRTEALLAHPSANVRETALHALSRLADPARLATACERLLHDTNQQVRSLVATVRAGAEA